MNEVAKYPKESNSEGKFSRRYFLARGSSADRSYLHSSFLESLRQTLLVFFFFSSLLLIFSFAEQSITSHIYYLNRRFYSKTKQMRQITKDRPPQKITLDRMVTELSPWRASAAIFELHPRWRKWSEYLPRMAMVAFFQRSQLKGGKNGFHVSYIWR